MGVEPTKEEIEGFPLQKKYRIGLDKIKLNLVDKLKEHHSPVLT